MGRDIWVDVSRNVLGDQGASAIKAALLACGKLTRIDLQGCGVTSAGALTLAEGVHGRPAGRGTVTWKGVDAFWLFQMGPPSKQAACRVRNDGEGVAGGGWRVEAGDYWEEE